LDGWGWGGASRYRSGAMSDSVIFNRLSNHCRIKHLHLIVKIAELGSLQKAAAAVRLSQPAATQALSSIETLLGMALFERHARGMRPTLRGQTLIRHAQQALRSTSEMAEAALAFQHGASGVVRLVAVAAGVAGILAETLPGFSRRHPDIEIEVNEVEQEQLRQWMGDHEGDLFFCRASTDVPQGYRFATLEQDRYVVATLPSHRLCQRGPLSLQDCAQETWLLPPQGVLARQRFEAWCASLGFEPRMSRVRSRALLLSRAMIREHHLLGVFPYQAIRQFVEAGELAVLPLEMPGHVEALGVMWRPQELGLAGQQFLGYAQTVLQGGPARPLAQGIEAKQ